MEPAAGGARGAARSSPPSGCRSEATAPPPPAAHACPQSRGWGAAGRGWFLSRRPPPPLSRRQAGAGRCPLSARPFSPRWPSSRRAA